jgi:signal transduction histidine kinase
MPLARGSDKPISLLLLERINSIVSRSREREQIVEQIIDEISSTFRADACWVQMFEPKKKEITLLTQRGFNQRNLVEITQLLGEILSSLVLKDGEPIIVPDVFINNNEVIFGSSSTDLHSIIITPLKFEGDILGAIGLGSKTIGKYTEDDLRLLAALSASIALTVSHDFNRHDSDNISRKDKLLFHVSENQELFSSLGHELQTPLTALIASAGLLEGELEKNSIPAQLRLIQNIMRSASNLQSRIVELLDLSHTRGSRLSVHLKTIDFPLILKEVTEELTPLVKSKGQFIVTELPITALVVADEQRLNQILLNLLSNAIKFSPKGGQITVRARKDKTDLIIEVQDTGPGISKKEQMKLFRPFYRVPADRLLIPGLGLGLVITKQMVELLGGNIFAFSLPSAEKQSE